MEKLFILMKHYQIKFKFKDKGILTVIKAENEAMAKQRILSLIYFVEVKEVKEESNIMDFINGFRV